MANSVYSAYAQSAGEINNNLASFRNDIDNVKSVNRQIVAKNKQLAQGAYVKTDMDALRGIGEEVAVRQFKKYGGKALDYVDKKFLGGNVDADTQKVLDSVKGKANELFGQLKGKVRQLRSSQSGDFDDVDGQGEGNELSEMTGGGEQGGEGIEEDGTPQSSAVDDVDNVDDVDVGDAGDGVGEMSFDDFMNQFDNVPRTSTGDIDFDRNTEQLQMGQEDARGKQMRDAQNETGQETKEDAPEQETKEDDPEPDDDAPEPDADDAGDAGDADDALGDALGEGAGEGAGDEALGAGLEGAGTALDATGVGAVIGVPLQIAGAVLEGGALYEAGKGVVDWVEQLFGKKPDVPTVKQVNVPKALPTLAQRGMLITPTMDTLDTQPSFAGGW